MRTIIAALLLTLAAPAYAGRHEKCEAGSVWARSHGCVEVRPDMAHVPEVAKRLLVDRQKTERLALKERQKTERAALKAKLAK